MPTGLAATGAAGVGGAALFARQQTQAAPVRYIERVPMQPLFRQPVRNRAPQGPSPYQKANAAVQRGFAGVGENYGSVVAQPKKAKRAVPSGAAAKINQMLGR